MHVISTEGYKNAGIDLLIIKKTGEIWTKMKDTQNGLGVQNNSDLVLKEIYGIKQKALQKSKLKDIKWLKEKFLKSLIT